MIFQPDLNDKKEKIKEQSDGSKGTGDTLAKKTSKGRRMRYNIFGMFTEV